jgi:natural product biosynthesis luciferase-like monooxygenase protein/amino acid adenylation domain-containing protein
VENDATKQVSAFPASFAQERLWMLSQMEPGDPAYHISGAVRFKGNLNLVALQASLNEVVRRQETLRTTFREVNGQIAQIIAPSGAIDLEVVVAENPHGPDGEAEFHAWLAGIMRKPFDLAGGPLLRAVLWKRAPENYTLVLVIHHIISDGWSLMVLIREVTELYGALVNGVAPNLPNLSIQYADYTVWQRKVLAEEKLQPALSYWKTKLDGLPVLDLPTDYYRPPNQQHRGGRQRLQLAPELSAALIEFSQRERTTLFMILLAGFKVLLHRYTGNHDVVVGTAVAGRKRPELEPLIGCFLNTLVLRTEIPENASFRQVLRQVREMALDAYSHEDTPFERVLEAVNPQRTLSRTPLFEVFVNMLALPEPLAVELPGVKAEIVELPEESSKFDITLYIYLNQGKIDLSLVYNADLFVPARMAEMVRQFEYLLEQIVRSPEQHISHFSLVSPQARTVLPDPRAPLDSKFEGPVHELFRSLAARSPRQLAVADPDVSWSYAMLEQLSNRLANCLLRRDVRRGDVVAIYAHRSAALVVALLGIMKSGGAFLVLDPDYPAARLVGYLETARPKALLELESAGAVPVAIKEWAETSGCARFVLPSSNRQDFNRVLQEFPDSAPDVSVGANDLACVSFTSGSMGIPKAVLGRHGSLSHFIPWTAEKFNLRPSDRFSMFSALSHDPLQRDVFTPLMIGASVFIPPEDWKLPGNGVKWMRENEISIVNLTPAIGELLTYGQTNCVLSSLRYVFFVGEALSRYHVSQIYDLAPHSKCVNYFGATETQRALGFLEISRSAISARATEAPLVKDVIPLGHGIKDTQLLVLNQAQELAGVGESGEIYVRSPHLAVGYLGDPKLTSEKFLLNPFTRADDDGLYRTGDLGRYLPDGSVEFAGRDNGQVKIRGFRVELGEIEARLKSHPIVRAAAADFREHPSGSRQLVGYVVLNQEQTGWQRALYQWLSEQLPDYMLPGTFLIIDRLPLTSNGKVERRALPEPQWMREEREREAAPTAEEEILCGIFSDVLKQPRVGINDNFFEMGGHSLLAMRVMSRVRQVFGVELALRALFEAPTVAELAKRVGRDQGKRQAARPLARVRREREMPLSYAQQRLWFLHQLEPESTAYNMLFGVRLQGALDADALDWSAKQIVKRHEILRTRFEVKQGTPVQVIANEMNFVVEKVDLGGWEEKDRAEEARRVARAEGRRVFDLQAGPLLRVKLLRMGEEEHVLVVTMHHIVSDAWSMGILVREFSELYGAHLEGRDPELEQLKIQYVDYSEWQREWLQGELLEEQLGYWRKQLAEVPVLEVPTDRPRPLVESHRGGSVQFRLSRELASQVQAFCGREGVTLFMTLLAAFQVVLGRYARQTDIAVGTDVANRNREETENLIGFFVNQLVLRTDISGAPSFRALATQIRQTALQAYERQDVPFDRVVEELGLERDLSRAPVFQVSLALQNTPESFLQVSRVNVESFESGHVQAKNDLELGIAEREGVLTGCAVYAADLYDGSTIERLLGHVWRVLEAGIKDAEQKVDEIDLLSAAEQSQVLEEHNQTEIELSTVMVHQAFECEVERAPEAEAVEYDGERWTYGELNRHANQLAHYLKKQGVQPEVRVGVYMERDLKMVMALVGILKAGGVYVPLDPGYPADRLAFMMQDANALVVITGKANLPLEMQTTQARVVSLERDWDEILCERKDNPESVVHLKNLAYVTYTSGSTGRPKGAMIMHEGLLNHVRAKIADLALNAEDVVAQNSPSSFDISIWQVLAILLVGGRVYVMNDDMIRSAQEMLRETEDHGITVLETVPAMLALMIGEQERAGSSRAPLSRLRWLFCQGEPLPSRMCSQWRELHPHAALVNGYGATECSDDVTHCHIEGPLPDGLPYAPLGFPLMNTTIFVLDPNQRAVPPGVAGELYMGGLGVGRGYLNRPELTAEKFMPNPYSRSAGERMYRTGDVCRWRTDGHLEFFERVDSQVKIRGQRIELREIETTLLEHDEVEQAVVLVRQDQAGDKRLVAYVVARDAEKEASSNGAEGKSRRRWSNELREYLKERLPEYMVPASWVMMEKLPLSPTGKADRKALPAPDFTNGDSGQSYSAPRNVEEEILCGIVGSVLRRKQVGVQDNFFEIGGHSLLATQVISRVRSAFNVDVPLRALFETPTVAQLAERVRRVREAGQLPTPAVGRAGRDQSLPLSFAQQRLWFLDQLSPGNAVYNVPFGVRLIGELDREALVRSLNEIVRRHEVLRTSFVFKDGNPVQVILEELHLELDEIEVTGDWEAEVQRRAQEEASFSFDLARGPLVRAKLLRREKKEHVLLVTMHHIVSDGWSTAIMVREFGQLYAGHARGQNVQLPELAIQYADYAVWQREWLQGEVLDKQVAYWNKQLEGIRQLDLPTDHPRSEELNEELNSEAGRVAFGLPKEMADRLEELSRSHGVTLFMTLLAGFQLVLGRWSGQQDVAVGVPIANRNRVETEGLIGFFVNTLVLRSRWADNTRWTELMSDVRQVVLEAYEYQDVPFEKLVEELEPQRVLNRTPLFQVMLILQNAPAEELQIPGIRFAELKEVETRAKFDLTLQMDRNEEGLVGSAVYAARLFSAASIERLLGHLRILLEMVLADQEWRVEELELLTEAERRQLLHEWNGRKRQLDGDDAAVHELIAAQAKRTPSAIAVAHENGSLTYAELDGRSNQLGRYLRELGVGPEVRVGVCADRSPEMVLAVLGVLKAGGAYVPLDPEYPQERQHYMLDDSGASLLLTQKALAEKLAWPHGSTVCFEEWGKIGQKSEAALDSGLNPGNLAYVIYTSGSTGKPKGVCVSHSNLSHFLEGIGVAIKKEPSGEWLAVTNLSFDISILEILWTLTAGFRTVIGDVRELRQGGSAAEESAKVEQRGMDFSLFYFAAEADDTQDKYRLLLEGARYGDRNGFTAVWTPERHFHEFGSIYANPAVTGAAVSTVTNRIEIRAGSVVLPLHDPLRVAEEWSMVDNLSRGRVALSFASGWQVNDFVLAPENYANRKEVMLQNVEVIRRLWRGERIERLNGAKESVQVTIYPKPVQPELRFWVTTAGNPESFRLAGESGGNLLTHLLGQSVEDLGKKIAVYREARKKHGHEGPGKVSLMVHTFVGREIEEVKEKVRLPFSRYLAQSIDLLRKPMEEAAGSYDQGDMEAVVAHAFNRYFESSGLMGTVESCRKMVERLKESGVDEVACLIDFGVDHESVLSSLRLLNQLRQESNRQTGVTRAAKGSFLETAAITHLQCTPSMAKLLASNEETQRSLRKVQNLFLGGEQLPQSVVEQMRKITSGQINNMYGPTETTIWSTMQELRAEEERISIGKPFGSNQVYVLDRRGGLVPAGVSGELYIGGAQVARGYLNKAEMTAERFVPDMYSGEPGGRMYRTGDMVRWRADGQLDFLGRIDEQVKIRGYRIELGEIEAVLRNHPGVEDAAVVAREETGGGKRLVGYLVGSGEKAGAAELRSHLRQKLPEYMVPSALVYVTHLPLTANGKIDRKALVKLEVTDTEDPANVEKPRTSIEEIMANLWMEVLRQKNVGVKENFFEIGGHSLLATQVISRVRQVFGVEMPLRALFEAPTVAGLAERVERMRGAGQVLAPPLTPVDRNSDLPLSYAQQRMWFLQQLKPESGAYNVPFGVRLSGELNKSALERSLNEIVRRHEVLRTHFVATDGNPVQVIRGEMEVEVEEIDLRDVAAEERKTEGWRLLREESSRPFDLTRGPLLRAKLLRLEKWEHVLLVNMHHIVSDGWSKEIMAREFVRMYEAYAQGKESQLEKLKIQYADYAVWQRKWLEGDVLEDQLKYWRRQLAGGEPLELPTDHARPGVMSQRGGSVRFSLGAELNEKLKDLSRGEGVTVFMSLLAALTVLLGKYAGQRDVAIGTAVANRNRLEVEDLIGFFVNTLVLRMHLNGEASLREVLKQVRGVTLDAYQHQDVPFEKLVEELQPERDLSRTPLFQVMLVVQNAEQEAVEIPGLRLSGLSIGSDVATFDLLISVWERQEGLGGEIRYALDLFESETVERMARHWERVLEKMVLDSGQRMGELSLLTEGERAQVVEEWNRTEAQYRPGCVQELLEEQVRRVADEVAVEYEGEQLSYGELNRRANQLGHYLRKQGVGPEARVGLCLNRSVEMIVGLLGILKAGGAYLPLDVNYPSERVKHILEDARAMALLTQRVLAERMPKVDGPVICIDEWEKIGCESDRNPELLNTPENLAYVIYTSGSTGMPKGVAIEQRQIVNYIHAVKDRLGLDRGNYATVSTLAADLGNTMLFPSLASGGTLHVISEERTIDGQRLGDYFEREEIDYLKIVPSHLAGLQNGSSGKKLMPRKKLIVGGEASPWKWVEGWRKAATGFEIANHYGPTEATVGVLTYSVDGEGGNPERGEKAVPLGRPLGNSRVYVLDEWMNPVVVGVEGELYVGGAGVGRAYVNRGDLTAECFVPDPFSKCEGSRLYRTGDRVRYLSNGNLEFLGRVDHQVKIHGFRVEPGEIESVLRGHAAIDQAVVVLLHDRHGENRLVAYVVCKEKLAAPSNAELREYVRQQLPAYMVPAAITQVPAIPLTANGKIDRDALPEPQIQEAPVTEKQVRSRGVEEEILCGILAEVLKLDSVGVQQNFFEAGGHSLLVTQVISRIRSAFEVEMPVRVLFETPTVEGLAEWVRRERGVARVLTPPLVRVSRSGVLPLSYAQQRLWFVHQLDTVSIAYSMPFSLRLLGKLDTNALHWSLQEIVQRHEILRTTFPSVEGRPMQMIADRLDLSVTTVDLEHMPVLEREAEARNRVREEASVPFDLSQGPLVRVKLLRLDDQDHVLAVNMHHIVSDGWSAPIMVREFTRLYEAFVKGSSPDLPELAIQYADFAVWQRQWLKDEILEKHLSFWRRQLAGVPDFALPHDAAPSASSELCKQERFELGRELTDEVKALSQREGVTLFMTLLAAYQLVLAHYTGQQDIVVGTDIASRNQLECEGLIGFFVNQLVLRTDLSGNPSFRQLLKRVKLTVLDAYAHQDVPFEKVVEELRPDRQLGRTPLFQVKLVLQNTLEENPELPGLSMLPFEIYETPHKFPVLLNLVESNEGLQGLNSHDPALFSASTMRSLLHFYRAVLSVVAADADALDAPMEKLLTAVEREAYSLFEKSVFSSVMNVKGKRQGHLIAKA